MKAVEEGPFFVVFGAYKLQQSAARRCTMVSKDLNPPKISSLGGPFFNYVDKTRYWNGTGNVNDMQIFPLTVIFQQGQVGGH